MKHTSVWLLKLVLFLVGLAVFVGLLWFPQVEGRAANLDLLTIYSDPFVIYIYLASIPFFVGPHQAFRLLNLIAHNKAFSQEAISALNLIKIVSIILIFLIGTALIYIRFFVQGDDPAGPIGLGIFLSFDFGIVATAAGIIQKLFQNAAHIQSEHELTV